MKGIIRRQYRNMEILNLEFAQVAETEQPIFVYRRELKIFRGNSKKCKVIQHEGVCPKSKLRLLRNEPNPASPYVFLHYTAFDEMRRFGYALQHAPPGRRYDDGSFMSEKPFTHFENGLLDEYMLVHHLPACGAISFSESLEEMVPVGIFMDYCEAKMNSANYNLVAAQKHLAARDDIFDLKKRYVPIYNIRNDTGLEYLEFIWGPNYEDCQRVYAEARKSPNFERYGGYLTSDIHKAVWDLDILGLKDAGCVIGYKDRDFYTPGITGSVYEDEEDEIYEELY